MKVASRGPASPIDRTAGTNIGNMTSNGGLAAAFDGNTSQAQTQCAANTNQIGGYVSKALAQPAAIDRVIIYGSNNAGYSNGTNRTITLVLYGKQGAAPSSATDGTILGTLGPFTDIPDESAGRTIASSDTDAIWDHVWVGYTASGGGARCAELQIYGWQ